MNKHFDESAASEAGRMSLIEATNKAKIVQGSSPFRGNQSVNMVKTQEYYSSNTSPQARRFQGTDEAAGKGISLITVTKIPQQ